MDYVGYVYRFYCIITQKNYIGITTQDINRRWDQHRNESLGDLGTKLNHFHLAIRKYGWDAFERFIILEVHANTKEDLVESLRSLETFYVNKYNSYKNGYNSTIGGEGVITDANNKPVLVFNELGEFIKECPSRISAAQEFNVLSTSVSDCCNRIIQSAGWKDNYRLIFRNPDDIITETDLIRIKNARKNKPVPVTSFDYFTGEIIKEYPSIITASQETGIRADSISSCALKKTKTTVQGGRKLVWRKEGEIYTPNYVVEAFVNNKSIGKFISYAHAAEVLGLIPSHISECVAGKRKSAGKYQGQIIQWKKL